jgi:hypothetical protein
MRASVSALLIAAVVVAACKAPTWRKQKADAEAAHDDRPSVTRSGDAEAAVPQYFEVDDKTGRSKSSLVLRLDYFPAPRPGSATLPSCYAPFDGAFELGFVMCDGRPDSRRPLIARNVDQDCYTDARRGRQAASEPLTLLGCKRGVVTAHKFEPSLRLDVELRDVN